MIILRYGLLFFTLIFIQTALVGQDGGYFFSHYSSTDRDINYVNFDISQDEHGIICIANRSGVIQFDGKNWELIKTPASIFSLVLGNKNVLYTGGIKGLGKVGRNIRNEISYLQLTDTTVQNIFKIAFLNNTLYGINSDALYAYNTANESINKLKSSYGGELLDLFIIDSTLYVNTSISGLQIVTDGELKSPRQTKLQNLSIEFVSNANSKNEYLIGTSDNDIYLYKKGKLTALPIDDNEGYLQESVIIKSLWVGDELAAFATLKGGVVFINIAKKKVEQIANYQSGLPDNEVYAIALDSHKGLWVAHNSGFTRISPHFPFRNFDRYPGLQGELLSVHNYKEHLYVGTSLGAYYLKKVQKFGETVVTEQKKIFVKQDIAKKPPDSKPRRKGLFGFLKRDDQKQLTQKESEKSSQYKTSYIKRINRELQSVNYKYEKIKGIRSKTFSFEEFDNRLFCGGLDGLFEVIDDSVRAITQEPIRYFYISDHYQKAFASTYNNQLLVFDISSSKPQNLEVFSDFHDYVNYIFEDHENRIWFCSNNELYWVSFKGDEVMALDEYSIENPYFYDTYGASYNDSVYFVNEAGILKYDPAKNRLTNTISDKIIKYLKDDNGAVWLLRKEKWTALGSDINSDQLNNLGLFTNIRYISYGHERNSFWVITDKNKLFKLSSTANVKDIIVSYELFLKNIRTTDEIILPKSRLSFAQDNSALTFEFTQPEYSGVLDIKYQYNIEGLGQGWSEWSSSYNLIDIPYLPDGDYILKLRSKNLISGIQEIEPIAFSVIPPYWKRPWFLAFEFSSIGLLLFVSVRLKKLGYRYRMMSRLLALLTLIIIIEFIQTVAETRLGTESSPVIDFLIQISVAIIILPVEGLIRKYIFREKDVQILDFISIKDKS